MFKFLNYCLDHCDEPGAKKSAIIIGAALWMLILVGFAACVLFFAYVFH